MLRRFLELDAAWSLRLRVAERPGKLRTVAAFLAHSGDSWLWGLGLISIFLAGDADWRRRALVLGVSIFLLAVVVLLIKFSVRRQRPPGEWGSIYRSTDPHSFPSGHAARALMLAVMAAFIGPPWLFWLLALWAPLVALARVAMGVHYLSDVLAGGGLGILTGLVFGKLFG